MWGSSSLRQALGDAVTSGSHRGIARGEPRRVHAESKRSRRSSARTPAGRPCDIAVGVRERSGRHFVVDRIPPPTGHSLLPSACGESHAKPCASNPQTCAPMLPGSRQAGPFAVVSACSGSPCRVDG